MCGLPSKFREEASAARGSGDWREVHVRVCGERGAHVGAELANEQRWLLDAFVELRHGHQPRWLDAGAATI